MDNNNEHGETAAIQFGRGPDSLPNTGNSLNDPSLA